MAKNTRTTRFTSAQGAMKAQVKSKTQSINLQSVVNISDSLLLSPQNIQEYEQFIPNFEKEVWAMARQETAHRHHFETQYLSIVETQVKRRSLVYCLCFGLNWLAALLTVSLMIIIAIMFGTNPNHDGDANTALDKPIQGETN